mgnify:CR=1 FL=1
MRIKTAAEIETLTHCGKMLAGIMSHILERTLVGTNGRDLADVAEQMIRDAGGIPIFKGYGDPPFPDALCVSLNDCVVHGIPSDYTLQSGDIVSLDIGMSWHGMITDMARTVIVGTPQGEDTKLLDATKVALDRAIAVVRPGSTTGDIGHAVQSYIKPLGYGIVRDLAGHGTGHALHEDPSIPNFGEAGKGARLEEGMVIAIEPMITAGSEKVRYAADDWSVMTRDHSRAAHFEDTMVVTANGCTVVTR